MAGAACALSFACGSEPAADPAPLPAAPVTNRLDVSSDVVNNLGITYEPAARGHLGVWHRVSGELEVPESRRWLLRAPARARVLSTVARWQVVAQGAVVATLAAPEVGRVRAAIELAERTAAQATREVAAAGARLVESEEHLAEARAFERTCMERLDHLERADRQGNPLTVRELVEARRAVAEASRARLDAAIVRDELAARVAGKQLDADRAAGDAAAQLQALAVLTGASVADLSERTEGEPAWRRIERLEIRAPADGVVVELAVAAGEVIDAGMPVARLFDTRELRFVGRVPEGDLGLLAGGSTVRLEFAASLLPPVETVLDAPLLIADPDTRMVHVQAAVANGDGQMAHGMSATAHVLVERSASEEVLVPQRCIVFDGLQAVVFKRDPDDPDVVVRTPVELGARAVDRVEVLAGVMEGDALVADGIRQLVRTGLGKAPEGGHFHADGTWHRDHE